MGSVRAHWLVVDLRLKTDPGGLIVCLQSDTTRLDFLTYAEIFLDSKPRREILAYLSDAELTTSELAKEKPVEYRLFEVGDVDALLAEVQAEIEALRSDYQAAVAARGRTTVRILRLILRPS